MCEGSGTSDRRYLLSDERGSVIGITNNAGTVTNVNSYDADGVPGAGNVGRFQYTGQMWLAEAGLYHYKARVYHPWLGRFLQTDPIGTAGGMNLYAYVGNDPVNGRDPSGLLDNTCWGGVPATSTGGCPPIPPPGSCYGSRINTAEGSACGGSYYDPSYYPNYDAYLDALEERPRGRWGMDDLFAVAEARGAFKIDPHASLAVAEARGAFKIDPHASLAAGERDYGWFRPENHIYVVGSEHGFLNYVFPTRGPIGRILDDYGPAVHTGSTIHDITVDYWMDRGVPFHVVAWVTVPPAYLFGFTEEFTNSLVLGVNYIFNEDISVPFTHTHTLPEKK